MLMDKRVVVALSFLACLVLIVGIFAYWTYERWVEKKLEEYIQKLEDSGYIVEECPLAEFHVEGVLEVHWFSDFRGIARQENVSYVYVDQEMKTLYFLYSPTWDGTEAVIFYYK